MAPSAPLRHVTVIMHISAGFYLFFPFIIFSTISDFISAAFFFFFFKLSHFNHTTSRNDPNANWSI